MQVAIEIFADEGLSNIFEGALVPQIEKETNRILDYRVIGYRLQNLEKEKIRVAAKSPNDGKGVYSARIYLNGVRRQGKNSLFFPQHWTKDDVINAILEAYQNKTLTSADARIYQGETADKVSIKLWLDENDKVIDAMPARGELMQTAKEKAKKAKSRRLCRICGKPKQSVCFEHSQNLPNPKISELIKKRIRYYSRKVYFNFARRLGLSALKS